MCMVLQKSVPLVGKYSTMYLSAGKACTVDTEDLDFLSQWKWFAKKSSSRWYATRKWITETKVHFERMHRVLAKTPPHLVCHHINGNSLDNRKCNLQNLTRGEHDIIHWYKYKKIRYYGNDKNINRDP